MSNCFLSREGLFIYYVSEGGGEGVGQMLTFADMGGMGGRGKSDMLTWVGGLLDFRQCIL